MWKTVFFCFFAIFQNQVFAQDWLPVASTDGFIWEGRAGTRTYATTRSGTPALVAQGRIFDKKEKTYNFYKWYVTVEDCKAGFGKLITLKMNGDFSFENDFVEGGGNVASSLAAMLCYPEKEKAGKGI